MATDFLELLPPDARAALVGAGRRVDVPGGGHIIRRGDRSDELFVVLSGRFEVVDTRSRPEVVLDALRPGDVVGEMALVDEAPRAADVRADGEGAVLRWERAGLLRVFEANPKVEAAFWRAVAASMAARLRLTSRNAVVGGISAGPAGRGLSSADEERVEALVREARRVWLEADAALSRSPEDPAPASRVSASVRALAAEIGAWLGIGGVEHDRARLAGAGLSAALRPQLVRSGFGALALDVGARRAGDPRVMAHLLLAQPRGEGALGRLLDAELMALPTSAAFSARVQLAAAAARRALPADRPAELLLIGVSCGVLLARLMLHLGRSGARVQALDGSREALAWVDAGLGARPANVSLQLLQEDLAALATAAAPPPRGPCDLILIDGLSEHLPDPLLRRLLGWGRAQLRPGGRLLLLGLAPSPDAALYDHLLEWPTIRRAPAALAALAVRAGLLATESLVDGVAVVVVAERPADGAPNPVAPL